MHIQRYSWRAGRWSSPLRAPLLPASWVLVFGPSRSVPRQALSEIRATWPGAVLTGCSTAGEIHGSEVADDSLAVAVVSFHEARVRQVEVHLTQDVSLKQQIARAARRLAEPELRSVFVLSEGINVNGTHIVEGVNEVLPKEVTVSGGLAADGPTFGSTWVLCDGQPTVGVVSLTGIYGNSVNARSSSFGGWDPFGPARTVTRASGNVLYELDGQPALGLYKKYLGDKAAELPGSALLFPLALSSDYLGRKGIVRTVLGIDEKEDSMTFAGDMPVGSKAQLMRANFDRLVDGATNAATGALASHMSGSVLSIAISCVGRRLVLGERIEDETEAVLDVLPRGTEQIGFYSYGELSSSGIQNCDLHNQTMTLTTLWEQSGR